MSTKKNIPTKKFITIQKFKQNILGTATTIYIIHLNDTHKCKKITLKNTKSKLKRVLLKNIKLFDFLTINNVKTINLNKNDSKIMEKILRIIKPNEKYNYCLNKDTLVIAETKTTKNNSFIKDFSSKHIMLCNETNACASGEMVIQDNTFIFDNASGSYQPTIKNIEILRKALNFFKIKIVDINSTLHSKFFKI
jgi:hypothetical protein